MIKNLILSIKIFILISIFWLLGFMYFVDKIPTHVNENDANVDAIVVLTGGSGRVDYGIKLLEKNYAKKLFISGVGKDFTILDLKRIVNNKDLKGNIFLGYEADDTVGNAFETMNWMKKNDFHSLILVTSNYHIPRSFAEFKYVMKDHVIIPYPVFSDSVRYEKWWAFPGTLKLIISEYHKFLFHKIKVFFF